MQTVEIGNRNYQHKMKRRRSRSPLQRDNYDGSVHRKVYKPTDKTDASLQFSRDDSGYWPDAFDDGGRNQQCSANKDQRGRKEGAKDTDDNCKKNKQFTHDFKVTDTSGKHRVTQEVPWVPPPLPEHLRPPPTPASLPRHQHLTLGGQHRLLPQNQFRNDGSFLEIFQKKMRETEAQEKTRPQNDEASTINRGGFSSQVLKRRISKVLKTGMVQKKKNELDLKGRGQESKSKDVWSSYMNEVHKYSADKCFDTDADTCRPLMK